MDKKVKKILKVTGAVVVGAALLGGAYGFGHSFGVDSTQSKIAELKASLVAEQSKPAKVEFVDKIVTVEKEVKVPVEVVKEIPSKDAEILKKVIYDTDGDLASLTEDLDEDEYDTLLVPYAVFYIDSQSLAENGVKKDLFDEVDNKVVTLLSNTTVTLDEDDLEGLKLDTDKGEVEVTSIDYEDKDAEVKVTGRFRQDDNKFKFTATAVIKDGEYDELKNVVVTHYE